MMNRGHWIALSFVALLPLACRDNTGTMGGAGPDTAASTAAAVEAKPAPVAPVTEPARRDETKMPGMKHAGPAAMLLDGARELTLRDDQRAALDKLDAQQRASATAIEADMKAFHSDLAMGVKAGKIDASAMDAHYAVIEKARQAKVDLESESLTTLYKTLDVTQRKTLVANARARMSKHEARMGDGAMAEKDKDGERVKKKLDRMTKELDLDAAQQKTVEGLLSKREATPGDMEAMHEKMKKQHEALLTAFEGDAFDAKKVELAPMPVKRMREHLEQQVKFLTQLLPVLRPDQREKLAASMGKMHHPGGHDGMAPGMMAPGMMAPGMMWEDMNGEHG